MAFTQSCSAYCPTQRSYTMSLSNSAYQTIGGSAGYQSLYSAQRRDLDLLDNRKETFIFYPQSSIPTGDIAAAGFYYTGEEHVIKCFRCQLTVRRLNDRDDPFTVHQSRAPNCPFVRKTVTQSGVSVPQPDEEDAVDGLALNSDSSLPSDVEDDGPSLDNVVPRGVPSKDVAVTDATVKPIRLAAPIGTSFHGSPALCK